MHNRNGAAPAGDDALHPGSRSSGFRRNRFIRIVAWAVFAALLLLPALVRQASLLDFPDLKATLGPNDPDDWVYLVQTRQWLSEGGRAAGFFDHFLHNTNAPFNGAPYHWTRPMEMLLSLCYFMTPRALPVDVRLMLGANWLAPFLCLSAGAFFAAAARRHFRHSFAVILPLLLIVFSRCFEANFEPGDADHHGFLCMMWCGVLFLLVDKALAPPRALLAGCLLGLMTWTCIEGVLLTGLVLGLLGVEALLKPDRAKILLSTAAGAALIVSLGLLVEVPARNILSSPGYDTLSIVHVTLYWLATAGAAMLTLMFPRLPTVGGRLAASAVAGGGVLLVQYLLSPKFFQGPLVGVDPFVFTEFIPNMIEMKPLIQMPRDVFIAHTTEPLLAAVLLLSALRVKGLRYARGRVALLLAALLAVTLPLTLFSEVRWSYYLQPVAITAIALLLPGLGGALSRFASALHAAPRSWRPGILLFLFCAAASLAARPQPETRQDAAYCMNDIRYVLQTQQLQSLLGNRNLVLYVSPEASGDTLFFTPYRIIASNTFEEAEGLKDLRRIETAPVPEDALPVLRRRRVDALLYCPAGFKPPAPESWLRKLDDGKNHPPWLTPVPGLRFEAKTGPRPLLFKIGDGE